ncbi:MAG: S8 family serine peptidase, partial [bacterium]|nr:S8 family serine peptidase [bacterium]
MTWEYGIARRLTGVCVLLATFTLASPASGQIRWRTGASPRSGIVDTAALGGRPGRATHVVVQFDRPVTPALRAELAASRLSLQAYLGDNAFFAAVAPGGVDRAAIAAVGSLTEASGIQSQWKLHPILHRGDTPHWAIVPVPKEYAARPDLADEIWIGAYVLFHRDVTPAESNNVAGTYDLVVRYRLRTVNGMVIELPLSAVDALAGDDAVQYLEPALPPLDEINDSVRAITEADVVQAPPYDLDGTGVTVLVYDGGTARATHVDFQGRLTARDASGLSDHATHVSGTIGGAGVGNAIYKGMAPGVTIESYGFEQVGGLQEGFLYTDPGDIEADYGQAINTYGAHIANNSIGTNTAYNGFPCEWEGDYGVTSTVIDSIVRGSLGGGPFRIVWANGNERGSGRCGTTYHTTAPPACAKNHVTVGALNSNDDSVTYFTSWGPTDDGRLKPDISAPGCQTGSDGGVTSCSSAGDSSYTTKCGTSMASPTVCGLSALLLQDYRAQFPSQPDFTNATLKALLAHNAQDIEAAGPDYMTGYGSVRIQQTVDFMRTGNFFEDQVDQATTYAAVVVVEPGDPELKLTLAWDDPPGTPNVDSALVNDLDLVVLDPNSVQHYPWTLGGLANPSAPAVQTQADDVNNIEQVFVNAPSPGIWTVQVLGFNVPQGPQTFSLCVTPRVVGDCNTNGINDLDDIASGYSQDCNSNGIPDECESTEDCNTNGVADICDIGAGTSPDVNTNGIPDECEADCNSNGLPDDYDIANGIRADCNTNGIPDECDIAGGSSSDCDTSAIPDACEADCNGNGLPDACDIASGFSTDCNTNGLPDECETDCNDNGIADECDIASGFSQDGNANGWPDECSILLVNHAATGADDGSTWANAMPDLQDALTAAAVNPDITEIWVAAGTYTPGPAGDALSSFELINGVSLYGGFAGGETNLNQRDVAGNETILSGDVGQDDIYEPWPSAWNIQTSNSAHVIVAGGTDASTLLDGFTVMAGSTGPAGTPAGSPAMYGSGIYNIGGSPTIRNCTFKYNLAAWAMGGAVYNLDGSPTITGCTFTKNYNHLGKGGAIGNTGLSGPVIRDCTFSYNRSVSSGTSEGPGAAIAHYFADLPLTVDGCTFDGNRAENFYPTGSSAGSYAGAIYHSGGGLAVSNCVFRNNWSNYGGAIFTWSDTTIENSLFVNNDAPQYDSSFGWGGAGGAIACSSFAGATIEVAGCTIVDGTAEDGGGIGAGGLAQVLLSNSILWNNSDNRGTIGAAQASGNITFSHCCIMNMLIGEPGEDPPDPANFPGSFDTDPTFANAAGGDFHVLPGSPCVDAGDPNMFPLLSVDDLDGLPRILCGRVDVGAYEMDPANYGCTYVPDPLDLLGWTLCLSGPNAYHGGFDCDVYDYDVDNDVDLTDFAAYQLANAGGSPGLDPPATISGIVQYAGPLSGTIHIIATSNDGGTYVYQTSIAAPGAYAIDIPAIAVYDVTAFMDADSDGLQGPGEPAGAAVGSVVITTAGQTVSGKDVVLAATKSISGQVALPDSTPVSGVTLTLTGPVNDSTTSAADGTYSFAGLSSGSYTVSASNATHYFYPFNAQVDIVDADVTGVDFEAHALPTGEVDGEVAGSVLAVDPANYNLTIDD